MIRALILFALLAGPASGQTRDAVFASPWQDLNGTSAGQVYARLTPDAQSQESDRQTCLAGQTTRIDWYDRAYYHDTPDPSVVVGRIICACQFDPRTTEPITVSGLSGVTRSGIHRSEAAAPIFPIDGDRMWSIYVRDNPSVATELDRDSEAKNRSLSRLLAANP